MTQIDRAIESLHNRVIRYENFTAGNAPTQASLDLTD